MIKWIKVTNSSNETIKFTLNNPGESGFVIANVTGISPGRANINISEITTYDGGLFNSAQIPFRSINLQLIYYWGVNTIEELRHESYKYFPLKEKITLEIQTDTRLASITGYVETNDVSIFSSIESSNITINCPDPYFYDSEGSGVQVTVSSNIEGAFEFPFSNESLTEDLIVFGDIRDYSERTVVYKGDASIGCTISIHAIGPVSNLMIYNVTTREIFKIDTTKLEQMTGSGIVAFDDIIIHTEKGSKSVTLLRNGVSTNILNAVDRSSDWISLIPGNNIFTISADDQGALNVQYTIENRISYEGI